MCLLDCTRVKDHLHDSWNWPRSPFDSSNFVRLSSTLKILGFHSKWMEIRCRVFLKRCVNVIGRNACAHLISSVPSVELFSFVQMSVGWYNGRNFCHVGGVINMIQNGVCCRAKLKRSNWFFLHFTHLLHSKSKRAEDYIKLERK